MAEQVSPVVKEQATAAVPAKVAGGGGAGGDYNAEYDG